MLGKKRIIENFEIIHSIQIGARELVVGVSPELELCAASAHRMILLSIIPRP